MLDVIGIVLVSSVVLEYRLFDKGRMDIMSRFKPMKQGRGVFLQHTVVIELTINDDTLGLPSCTRSTHS
jgi:hypothetical protein